MRPKLAVQSENTRARCLVLGPREIAEKIVEKLTALGIPATAVGSPRNERELTELLQAHPPQEGEEQWVHPGISSFSEKSFFPTLVAKEGRVAISPSAKILSLYSNKVNFLAHGESLGIPHLVQSLDPFNSAREIRSFIETHEPRFPLLLKSIEGGAGFGSQLLRGPEDLDETLPAWLDQLRERYGDSTVLIERTLGSARHLIVPFASFAGGEIATFPVIDGSLQSRWKRFIQFCPAIGLEEEQATYIRGVIRKWVESLGYFGFGTLEFLVEADHVYLIDGAARLNAAFPLFEGVAGISAVEWQLAAMGLVPRPVTPESSGHDTILPASMAGVSVRLYAEDPIRHLPSPGWIQEMSEVRSWTLDSARAELLSPHHAPSEVKTESTGVIGELLVFGGDRKRAIAAANRVLGDLWIAGSVVTNQKFALEHLSHPFVRENLFHAGFSDEEFIPEMNPDALLLKKLVTIAHRLLGGEKAKWVVGGLWVDPLADNFVFSEGPIETPSEKGPIFSGYARFPDGPPFRFSMYPLAKERWVCRLGLWNLILRRVIPGAQATGGAKTLSSLVSGRVHALFRQAGTYCEPRSRLVIVESLGQLVQHAVVYPSRIIEWMVQPGDRVEVGQDLAKLELLR